MVACRSSTQWWEADGVGWGRTEWRCGEQQTENSIADGNVKAQDSSNDSDNETAEEGERKKRKRREEREREE